MGMWVHDEFCGRGIGSALMAALIDVSDIWLNLKRLELTVYVDNEPAIRLYKGSSHSPWIGRSQPDPLTCRLLGRGFEPEHFLQEPRRRDLVFAIGALFGGVLGIGEGVLGTAEELQLEAHFGGSQLLDQGTDLGERRDRVFGAMENQHTALDVLGGLRREVAERAVHGDHADDRN